MGLLSVHGTTGFDPGLMGWFEADDSLFFPQEASVQRKLQTN